MVASIQLHNTLAAYSAAANTDNTDKVASTEFSKIYNEQLAKEDHPDEMRYSSRISNINQAEVEEIYERLKEEVRTELEESNFENKKLTLFDYLNANIDGIMDFPIEVKIERDEINQAIIYNRLGINFLEVKEIEVRMELLNLAEAEVKEQEGKGHISGNEAQVLFDQIESSRTELMNKKQKLLEGNKEHDKDFFERLTSQRSYSL